MSSCSRGVGGGGIYSCWLRGGGAEAFLTGFFGEYMGGASSGTEKREKARKRDDGEDSGTTSVFNCLGAYPTNWTCADRRTVSERLFWDVWDRV